MPKKSYMKESNILNEGFFSKLFSFIKDSHDYIYLFHITFSLLQITKCILLYQLHLIFYIHLQACNKFIYDSKKDYFFYILLNIHHEIVRKHF